MKKYLVVMAVLLVAGGVLGQTPEYYGLKAGNWWRYVTNDSVWSRDYYIELRIQDDTIIDNVSRILGFNYMTVRRSDRQVTSTSEEYYLVSRRDTLKRGNKSVVCDSAKCKIDIISKISDILYGNTGAIFIERIDTVTILPNTNYTFTSPTSSIYECFVTELKGGDAYSIFAHINTPGDKIVTCKTPHIGITKQTVIRNDGYIIKEWRLDWWKAIEDSFFSLRQINGYGFNIKSQNNDKTTDFPANLAFDVIGRTVPLKWANKRSNGIYITRNPYTTGQGKAFSIVQ